MPRKTIKPKMHHVGVWIRPADVSRTLRFFEHFLDFSPLSRGPRKSGGERIFLSNPAGQYLEILVDEQVEPGPDLPPHPVTRIRGAAHLCFSIADAVLCKAALLEDGYDIELEVPSGLDGYVTSEMGEHRILFFLGPAGLSIEFFEFRHEAYPLD
ncbi:MAG: hypothetical protein Hens3KO_13750 [Henriciella sp.]